MQELIERLKSEIEELERQMAARPFTGLFDHKQADQIYHRLKKKRKELARAEAEAAGTLPPSAALPAETAPRARMAVPKSKGDKGEAKAAARKPAGAKPKPKATGKKPATKVKTSAARKKTVATKAKGKATKSRTPAAKAKKPATGRKKK